MMEPIEGKVCLNSKCKTSSCASWKLGWCLHSGLCADLCESCGLAFVESRFCEMFHSDDSGWRTCTMCGKRVHCGCIASTGSYVLLDTGGVSCTNCTKEGLGRRVDMNASSMLLPQKIVLDQRGSQFHEIIAGAGKSVQNAEVVQRHSKGLQLMKAVHSVDANQQVTLSGESKEISMPISVGACIIGSLEGQSQTTALLRTSSDKAAVKLSVDISQDTTPQNSIKRDDVSETGRDIVALETMAADSNVPVDYENFGSTFGSMPLALSGTARDVHEIVPRISGASSHRSRQRQFLPHFSISAAFMRKEVVVRSETADESPARVGRANGEGKVRSQLLPRYMPRISNQEMLQIISGDKNAIITPLFEKILSASDAGRIGRLVLPKACAEAYFPSISLPEGQPLDIHDITGKKWTFQFRYWPNNNSRMYVLEGVTPCIQHIGLQAGDTVTFSRLDPEGKLVMGYRKASASLLQDPNNTLTSGGNCTTPDDEHSSLPSMTPQKGFVGNTLNQSNVPDTGFGSSKYGKASNKAKETAIIHAVLVADKKRGHPLGSKSKRLRIDNDDALELKTTWEEAQDLLRPPPGAIPSIVTIDGHEFEEYEDPPVLSKKTIFRTVNSGEQEQWIQCDDCFKRRKVPIDAVLHTTRWTCSDNQWDQRRATCIAPLEISESELYQLSGFTDFEEM